MKSPLFSKREDVSGTKSMSGCANAGNTLRRNAVYCAYCAGIILCGIVLGFVLLLLVELLPKGSMVRHMQESVSVLAEEGSYPVLSSFRMSTLDNVTDALILGSAAYDGEGSLLDTVLLRYRYICSLDGEALDGLNSLIAYYSGYPGLETSTGDYPRYWHGYLLYVKPLLCLLNYQQIRALNTAVQTLLVLVIVFLLWRNYLDKAIPAYLLIWGILLPPFMGKSLQYSSAYYIFSVAVIVLLLYFKKWVGTVRFLYFFLIIGMATSYFDLLTYPVATVGIPLVFYFLLKCAACESGDTKESLTAAKESLIEIVKFSAVWCVGYVFMWAGKWILANLLTDQDIMTNAYQQILFRISHHTRGNYHIPVSMMYADVIGTFFRNPVTWIALVYIAFLLIWTLRRKNARLDLMIPLGTVALFPFLWYFMTTNHSIIHSWFTCRNLVVTMLGVMCMFALTKDKRKKRKGMGKHEKRTGTGYPENPLLGRRNPAAGGGAGRRPL